MLFGLFEQLFELFAVGCLFSSKLFELVRVVVFFVVVIPMGPNQKLSNSGETGRAVRQVRKKKPLTKKVRVKVVSNFTKKLQGARRKSTHYASETA